MEHEIFYYTGNNWSHGNGNKRFNVNLEAIPEKHSIDSKQKTAILRISHIIQKELQSET